MAARADDQHYGNPREVAFAFADAVHTLFAAGADIVQLDEPLVPAKGRTLSRMTIEELVSRARSALDRVTVDAIADAVRGGALIVDIRSGEAACI